MICSFIFLCLLFNFTLASPPVNSIPMKVFNAAGAPIELYWVNTFDKPEKLVKQTTKPIRNSTDASINSYNSHVFEVKFLNHIEGTEARFAKGPREEVVTISYDTDLKRISVRQTTKFDEIMETMAQSSEKCNGMSGLDYSKCLVQGVINDVTKISEQKARMTQYRDAISARLRNYTCSDVTMNTTECVSSSSVSIQNRDYFVEMLLDLPNSKIWTVKDFVSSEECSTMINHARPLLSRATIAADDGTNVVSEHRKAQQAGYDRHFHDPTDPIVPLYDRVIGMANELTGLNIPSEGQEDFTIIQYNAGDEYSAHCDGACHHETYTPKGRVATAVLYCTVPQKGGSIAFSKSDVFINPEPGMAVFFSYKGPDGRMDEGFTEHSGCPIIEGEKWISTLWMREGVSSEHPWYNFDPQGNLLADEPSDPEASINHDEL